MHGDYRLDNTMLVDDGTVAAVLDWEICTLGDPLADVGLLMVYWTEPGDAITRARRHSADDRAGLRHAGGGAKAMYAERTGRDVDELDYYVAFGYWKLACILQGVGTPAISAGPAAATGPDETSRATCGCSPSGRRGSRSPGRVRASRQQRA